MAKREKRSEARWIPTNYIKTNPENPRIIFDSNKMDQLLKSISEVGILVPLTVFPDKTRNRYVLLDGERRLKCAEKLNLPEVPVNIIKPPTKIENILRMFNIHKVRAQWDLMPTAWKLKSLSDLIEAEKRKKPTEKELSILTGMTISEVRRSKKLLTFPNEYQQMVLDGQLKTDFLIEMYPVIRTIENNLPDFYQGYGLEGIVSNFLKMHETGRIEDVTDFRYLQKILRAKEEWLSIDKKKEIIEEIFRDSKLTFDKAYEKYVKSIYDVAGVEKKCISLIQVIESLNNRAVGEQKSLVKILSKLKTAIETTLTAAERS